MTLLADLQHAHREVDADHTRDWALRKIAEAEDSSVLVLRCEGDALESQVAIATALGCGWRLESSAMAFADRASRVISQHIFLREEKVALLP